MNTLGKKSLRLLYYQYRDSVYYSLLIAAFAIAVCIVLLFQVVIPQVQNWFSIANEIEATRARLAIINNNITFMNALDKNMLTEQLIISTKALPLEKDFGAMVNALSDASIRSGVSFDDYNFQPGNIASVAGELTDPEQKGFGFTKVTFSVSGDATKIQSFLQEINEKLPLSEVISVKGDIQKTTVVLHFYQKQFPHLAFNDTQPLPPLSPNDVALIHQLSQWQTIGIEDLTVSTESAVPLF